MMKSLRSDHLIGRLEPPPTGPEGWQVYLFVCTVFLKPVTVFRPVPVRGRPVERNNARPADIAGSSMRRWSLGFTLPKSIDG